MSRFPGLQFPTSNSGQPQTRGQQRPGANLLQRFFALKGDKLARQGQKFQEDSFNSAKDAYEGSLQTYETNKAAHDASEKSKYDAAQSRYDSGLQSYNTAKGAYDTQVNTYNNQVKLDQDYSFLIDKYDVPGQEFIYQPSSGQYLTKIATPYQQQTGALNQVPYNYNQFLSQSTKRPTTRPPVTATLPATFNVAPPTFDYTAEAFGSDVPSFNYVAPESPGAKTVNKLATMSGLANQLQEVLPENARNRNRNPTSFYNIF